MNVTQFVPKEPKELHNVDFVAWRIKKEKERANWRAVRTAYIARPRLRATNH